MSVLDPATISAPRRLHRGRALGTVGLAQVITWQMTALGAAAAFGWAGRRSGHPPYAVIVGVVLGAMVILWFTATRRGHYWRYEWIVVRRRYKARTAADARSSVDPFTSLVPRLTPRTFVDRTGVRHGMLGTNSTWAVVLRLQPRDSAVVGTRSTAGVDPEVLAAALASGDNRIASAQVVLMSAPDHRGSQAPGPADGVADRAEIPVLSRQTGWLALRLDPRQCPSAVRARGGGVDGAQRALASAAARAAIRLADTGVDARVLDADDVRAALRRCLGLSDTAPSGPASLLHEMSGQNGHLRERWEDFETGGTTHATYWIRRWPRGRRGERERGPVSWFLTELAAAPAAAASVVSTTLSRTARTDVNMQTLVRFLVPALSPIELNAQVREIATRWGAMVVRLEGEQVPGAVATLPTGGPIGVGLLAVGR